MKIDDAVGNLLADRDIRIGHKVGNVRGRNVINEINIAGQQGGNTGRIRLDRFDRDCFPFRLFAPVVFETLKDQLLALDEFNHLERTGTNGGLARIEIGSRGTFSCFLRQNSNCRDISRHQRVGGFCRCMNCEVIDLLEGFTLDVSRIA